MLRFELDAQEFVDRLSQVSMRLSNLDKLWVKVTRLLVRVKDQMFDGQSVYGMDSWPGISPTMYGHLRYGSLGGVVGRYTASSKPLNASQAYRRSFKMLSQTPRSMTYGSSHPLANVIPFAGWNRADGLFRVRRAVPDADLPLFVQDVGRLKSDHVRQVVEEVFR